MRFAVKANSIPTCIFIPSSIILVDDIYAKIDKTNPIHENACLSFIVRDHDDVIDRKLHPYLEDVKLLV